MKTEKTTNLAVMILLSGLAFAQPSFAQDNTSGYYLKPIFGYSSLGGQTGIPENTGFENGDINVNMSGGFTGNTAPTIQIPSLAIRATVTHAITRPTTFILMVIIIFPIRGRIGVFKQVPVGATYRKLTGY